MANKDKLLSTMEIAEVLGVTHQSIYLWRGQGCPHIKLGERTYRYDLQEVIDWRTKFVNNRYQNKEGVVENGKK